MQKSYRENYSRRGLSVTFFRGGIFIGGRVEPSLVNPAKIGATCWKCLMNTQVIKAAFVFGSRIIGNWPIGHNGVLLKRNFLCIVAVTSSPTSFAPAAPVTNDYYKTEGTILAMTTFRRRCGFQCREIVISVINRRYREWGTRNNSSGRVRLIVFAVFNEVHPLLQPLLADKGHESTASGYA